MNIAKEISSARRIVITITVMTATVLQALDTTIVNVALPHMQGALGANSDQISWIITSYLVSSAILMPLTGFFTDVLGRKNYFTIAIAGFVLASGLCGASESLSQIVIFRLMQGTFGSALVPLSQAILADIYLEEDRGKAMAIWGMGVMVGPILGPTLGGYLTEVASWRWTFYVNVPIGALAILLAWEVVPDTLRKLRKMDWVGLVLISTAIGAVQYVLDRGSQDDWFESPTIFILSFLSIMALLAFLFYNLSKREKRVFDLQIFKDRNFSIACCLMGLFGLGLFGAMIILPLMLENLFNYPASITGLVMAPRGISSLVSMLIVARIIKRVDIRYIIITGICIGATGMFIGTYYNLYLSPVWIIGPILLQGFGIGMIFVPLSTIAFLTLNEKLRAEAAGLFSLLRTIGSSIGVSIIVTLFSRLNQTHWNQLGGMIQPYNPALKIFLLNKGLELHSSQAVPVLGKELIRQSQMLSFVNVYAFIGWSFLAMLPFVFLLKRQKAKTVEVIEG